MITFCIEYVVRLDGGVGVDGERSVATISDCNINIKITVK
jgi:hypothetical protein